jgi:hypothetical protein
MLTSSKNAKNGLELFSHFLGAGNLEKDGSQNDALVILFQIIGHLALYLSFKTGSSYSFPHLSISEIAS